MRNTRLWFIVLSAIAVWAFLQKAPKTEDRDRNTTTIEPVQPRAATGQILEDMAFENYSECVYAAEVAVQDLKDKGVSVALVSNSPLAERTVYKVYYREATGQISCRGGRLVNEIFKAK